MKRMLMIIDAQYDFINGTLPVGGAEEAMNALTKFLNETQKGVYDSIVLTADFHTWNHVSFGEWPIHCVAHTHGAAIWQSVLESAYRLCDNTVVLTKGTQKEVDEYSIMKNGPSRARLVPLLNEADTIDVCGIAGDICVLNSIKDLVEAGYKDKLTVLMPFCPSLDGGVALNDYVRTENLKSIEQ